MLEWCIVPIQFISRGATADSVTTAIRLSASVGLDARRWAVVAFLVRPRTVGAGDCARPVCALWRGVSRAACGHPAGPGGPAAHRLLCGSGFGCCQPRCGRRSVIRRQRLDLELLLIIRRAERQADLRGRSRSDESAALMAVQRAARRADRPACAIQTRATTPADRVHSEFDKGGSRRRRA